MANQDKFKKIGSFLGETLDKATSKISDTVENFDKEEFKENVSDFSKKVVDTATQKYDKAVGDDKYCAVCGKKLGIIGKRKIADGTLCNQCSIEFKSISEKEHFALSQKSSTELIELREIHRKKQKKLYLLLVVAWIVMMLLLFGGLSLSSSREKKKHKNQIDISSIKYSLNEETYESIEQKFRDAGFTNIVFDVSEDLPKNKESNVGIVDKIEINGNSSIKSMEWVDKDATVKIFYHLLEPEKEIINNENDESPSSSSNFEGYEDYTNNDKDHYKNGDSGKYSYIREDSLHDFYLIIDFDEGYVYYFLEGDGNTECDKVPITSGNLNDVVIITFRENETETWNWGLHFKWVNQPDHLVLEDDDHFEYDFYTTDLNRALNLRDKKKIITY
ncbi:MAG: DUF4428 domain-containing protein [Erysipelotrichaceae bacterium]|nr:DUF4428 domain-containing protein [Erysipelotrichaceae bacterium]